MRNHDIERIYMQQLRNLESAVYVLRRKKREYEEEIEYLKEPLVNPEKPEKPEIDMGDTFIFGVFLGVLVGGGMVFTLGASIIFLSLFDWIFVDSDDWYGIVKNWTWDHLLGIGIVVAVLTFIIYTIKGVRYARRVFRRELYEYEKNCEYYNEKCKENAVKKKRYTELLQRRVQQLNRIENELRKGLALRNNLYSYDWIPVNYRNIRVAYYISDMVTTSAITIEEALKYYLLQEVNNKLDEVLRRLDEIIRNQNQMFIRQAILEAQNEKKIRQNETMIRQMAQIETNTEMVSQYAKLAANYTEANAYFSWACYLSNNK